MPSAPAWRLEVRSPSRRARVGLLGALRLVGRELVDASLVSLIAGERLGKERVHQFHGLFKRVLTPSDSDYVGVVVLACQLCGVDAPRKRRSHAGRLVGRDLLAVSGAADHDAQGAGLRNNGLAGLNAKRRIVVKGVVDERTVVDHIVTLGGEVLEQVFLELEPGMVRCNVNTHGDIMPAECLASPRGRRAR